MKRLRQVAARLMGAFASRRRDAELDDEVRLHLEMLADEHRRRGLSAEDARLAAHRDFGGVARTVEAHRQQRGLPFVDTLVQDVRYALRLWKRAPGFAAVVVIVLALGIGANSAMFTFVNALLLRPLPGRAGELIGLYSHDPTVPNSYRLFSYPNYLDIRDHGDLFDGLIARTATTVGVLQGDAVRRTFAELASSNYFSVLGVQLAAGRTFTAEEERPGADRAVAIAGYAAWQASGFDPSFIGRTIRINYRDFTIVGVAPKGFTGTTALLSRELWLPLGVFDSIVHDQFKSNGLGLMDRGNNPLWIAGLLRAGITARQAEERLAVLSADLQRAYPAENHGHVLTVHTMSRVNMSSSPSSDAGPAVLSAVIMPLSGGVLLIACFNIANMLLARGTVRRKEIAIRVALGGGRARLVRQLLTESLVLAAVAALVGVAFGWWTTQWIAASLVPIMPVPIAFESRPDLNIILMATFFTAFSAIACGLAPALALSRPDVVDDLKDGGARAGGRFGTRSWLVIAQVAVSLVLMTAGGLFARAALRASTADPGYRYDGLLLASVEPGLVGISAADGLADLQTALERLRQLPGVSAAGAVSQVPFGDFHQTAHIERPGDKTALRREPTYSLITTDYFKTIGLTILRGRDFTALEATPGATLHSAIVDEPLARMMFPGEDPLGQEIRARTYGSRRTGADGQPLTIVGLVPGLRDELTDRELAAHVYVPWTAPSPAPINIHVRAQTGSGVELLQRVRQALHAVDPKLPIIELRTMQEFHDRGLLLWAIQTAGRALVGLGGLALLLAAIGVYGVKSYMVSQRTREIGIRLALGARRREIGMMLLRDGARTTLVGIAIGFPFALLLGQLLSVAIFEVSAFDPIALVIAPLVLAAAAALATYIPARRGMRVSPLDALRSE